VVQDNVYGDDLLAWIGRIVARPVHLVVLRPSVEMLARRHEQRRLRTGKVAYRGAFTPELNDEALAATPRHLGLWLDTSHQSPDETVDEALARSAEAIVR
jgi:chloramphenicol 3-O-phosphotransferase